MKELSLRSGMDMQQQSVSYIPKASKLDTIDPTDIETIEAFIALTKTVNNSPMKSRVSLALDNFMYPFSLKSFVPGSEFSVLS